MVMAVWVLIRTQNLLAVPSEKAHGHSIVSTCIRCNRALTAESSHVLPPQLWSTNMPQDLNIAIARTDEALRELVIFRRRNLAVEVVTRSMIDRSRMLLKDTAEIAEGYSATARRHLPVHGNPGAKAGC